MKQQTFWGACACSLLLGASGCAVRQHTEPHTVATSSISREQAVQILIHQGYRDIRDLQRNGEDWTGVGTKHGQVLNFDVDKTGNVNTIPPPH